MASTSLYNRWRPSTFAQRDDAASGPGRNLPLVGQEHVTRTLRNAVAAGQMSHAYLFCGPRGTGKTSAARILARAVNCRRGLQGEPCNECENCEALLDGRQLDLLIEIDGASNRGVDDVRALRERIMQRPGGGGLTGAFKVYIVDEVHMLTTEAFNALLKSLEEPPPHVIFILCTTDPQKVPATVASRCQRFDFRPIAFETLVRHLAHVAAAEGVTMEPAGLELLARTAAGGARDAVSLLDQSLAFSGADGDGTPQLDGKRLVTAQQIQAMLGLTDFDAVCRLVDALAARDVASGLRLVQEVASKGSDLRQFARQSIEFLRAVLLFASNAGDLASLDDETKDAVQQRAERLGLGETVRLIKLFTQAEQGLKAPSAQPQLPLELAVVEASMVQLAQPTQALSRNEAAIAAPAAAGGSRGRAATKDERPVQRDQPEPAHVRETPTVATAPRRAPEPEVAGGWPRAEEPDSGAAATLGPAPSLDGPAIPAPEAAAVETVEAAPEPAPVPDEAVHAPETNGTDTAGTATLTSETVRQRWPAVLDAIRQQRNRPLEALLRDAEPGGVDAGNVLVLVFRFPFHASKVQEPANIVAVQRAATRALGTRVTVRCEVADGGGARTERARQAAPADDAFVGKAMRMLDAKLMTSAEVAALEELPIVNEYDSSTL
ncbi:MAG: DNA polymerase III subunits gamma and tau [uncultured Chloroflexi bacterium]|uniref:DNA polymerase III subunit gamma/tau n=1 Tax=uncultured Chloroflexota bacterium TaxID=166587 RepID=A0A6J4K218_9CHLR|nr:MAG: DNA polymerase III subunits gamma and tau [uncultured Chloroflexota bacterium]